MSKGTADRICSVHGCGRQYHAKGVCKAHYHQIERGRPLRPLQPRGLPTRERVLSCVPVGDPASCWEWTGTRMYAGYGRIRIAGRNVRAHRAMWECHFGPIPEGLHVLHRCDNPPCVNPSHLWLGTYGDNNRDRVSKGRWAMGHEPRLTAELVREIRRRRVEGQSFRRLASEFGVSTSTVRSVTLGRTWRWVA